MDQNLLQNLMAGVPLPLVFVGTDEKVAAANVLAHKLFGEGLVGRHYITALRQPGLLDCIERVLASGQNDSARYLTSEASRETSYLARAVPVFSESGDGVLVSFEDTTPMQQVGRMRRDFVANVSHELRTPLTALLGFIETLRGAARDDPAARDRFLDTMEKEATRMNRLVGDLLSLSRVESEERVRPTQPVDVASILQAAADSVTHLADPVGVDIKLEIGGVKPDFVVPGDADQLMQVFTNLIENAIKYGTKPGTVRLVVSTKDHEPMLRGPAVRVDVLDQGDCIEEQHIPRLTERFYRVDNHRSREMGGTGLGLAIAKHIVNRHRGRMPISCIPDQGNCFSVILPKG